MKRLYLFCLLSALGSIGTAFAADMTIEKKFMFDYRGEGHSVTTLIDGRVLAVGGWESMDDPSLDSAETFNPKTALWSLVAPMSTPRRFHTATRLLDGRVLVVGGGKGYLPDFETPAESLASAEIFNPLTNTWSAAGSLTGSRYDHQAVLLADGRVMITGGRTAPLETQLSSSEIYDPQSGTWSSASPMPYPIYKHRMSRLSDNRILVSGGWCSFCDQPGPELRAGILSWASLYDPAKNQWTRLPNMAQKRWGHAQIALNNGEALVLGGYELEPRAEKFNTAANKWTTVSSLADIDANVDSAIPLTDDRILVVGGGKSVEVSLNTLTTSFPSSMLYLQTRAKVDRLLDGRPIAVGGNINGASLELIEVYDPAAHAWAFPIDSPAPPPPPPPPPPPGGLEPPKNIEVFSADRSFTIQWSSTAEKGPHFARHWLYMSRTPGVTKENAEEREFWAGGFYPVIQKNWYKDTFNKIENGTYYFRLSTIGEGNLPTAGESELSEEYVAAPAVGKTYPAVSVSMVSPTNGSKHNVSAPIRLEVSAEDPMSPIVQDVFFYVNGEYLTSVDELFGKSLVYEWTPPGPGHYTLKATARSFDYRMAESAEIQIDVTDPSIPPPPLPPAQAPPTITGFEGLTPTLSRAGVLRINITGTFDEMRWTFIPETPDSLTAAKAAPVVILPAGSYVQTTRTSQLSLSGLPLNYGAYRVQVVAVNSAGQSALEGRFALVPDALSSVKVRPSPWRADLHRSEDIIFEGLTAGAALKLFSLSGRSIKTLQEQSGTARWNLKNDSGEDAASGLYLYLITDPQGGEAKGKFAIIR